MTPSVTRAMALAAAAALALAGAGCGSDDDTVDQNGSAGDAARPTRLAIELSGSPRNPSFEVPDTVEGGLVEIAFTSSVAGEHSPSCCGPRTVTRAWRRWRRATHGGRRASRCPAGPSRRAAPAT